jgi:hypothetical protein
VKKCGKVVAVVEGQKNLGIKLWDFLFFGRAGTNESSIR